MGHPKAREAETYGERLAASYVGRRFNGTHAVMLGRMIDVAIREERERCAQIAEAIDSGRGNEKQIATAIRQQPQVL